jgi:uncharacterized protein (TIGR03067 family)
MTHTIPLLLTIGLITTCGDDEAAKKDLAQLEGVWKIARVDVEGVTQPEAPLETSRVIIKSGGEYVVVSGREVKRGKLKADPTKTPKQIQYTLTHGRGKGNTFSSIYSIDGDTYKVCGSFRGGPPPAVFESTANSGLVFQVLERSKLSVKDALIDVERIELEGTWQAVSYALDGNAASSEDMAKIKLSIEPDGRTTALRDSQPFIAATSTLDPTTNPMQIDFTYTLGSLKGQTAPGIYKIEDEVLTICRSAPGQARPVKFESKPGSGHTLMSYKRENAPGR